MPLDGALMAQLGVPPSVDFSKGNGDLDIDMEGIQEVGQLVRFRQNLFMLLYLLAKDSKTSLTSAYFQAFIGTCQLVYFAVGLPGYKWHSFMYDSVVPVLRITNFQFMKYISDDFYMVSFIFAFSLVVIMFALCGWIMYMFWTSGTVRHLWVLPFLRWLMRMLTSVLYLPVLTILSSALSCDRKSPVDAFAACETPERVWVAIAIAILLVVFILFNGLVSFTVVDNNPVSQNALARVHGRVDALHLLIRAILSFSFTFTLTSTSTIPMIVVVVSCGVIGTGAYLMYLPFLNPHVNRLHVASNGVFLWAGICLILAEVIGRKDDFGAAMSFMLGIPLIICTSSWIVGGREAKLGKMEPHPGISSFEIELILRFKHHPCRENWAQIESPYRSVVELMYGNDAFLMVTLACIADKVGRNEVLSSQLMRKISGMSSKNLDQSFLVFQYFQKRRERTHGAEGGALSYVALTHHRKSVETEIKTLLELGYKLWSMLEKLESGSSSSFFQLATQIHTHSALAKDHLSKLVQISNGSKRTLQLYAVYAEYVMNDKSLAKKLLRAAEAASTAEDMNSVLAVTISGDPKSLGHILDCTDETPARFGMTKQQLMGKNISILCPPPFDAIHDKFLTAYLENNTNFVTVTRTIWARHVTGGYAMQMKLTISPQQEASGALSFVGTFNADPNAPDFICVDKNGNIKFFSAGMATELGIRNVGGENNIYTFIPELENAVNLRDPSNDTRIELELEEATYEVTLEECGFRKNGALAELGLVILNFHKIFTNAQDDGMLDESEFGDDVADMHHEHQDNKQKIASAPKRPISARPPPLATSTNLLKASENNEDEDEIQSKSSRQSGSSSVVSKTVATMNALQAMVQARVENDEQRLRQFASLISKLIFLFWVFALASLLGSRIFWSQFHDLTELLILSAERAYAVIEATLAMEHHLNVLIPNATEEAQLLWDLVPEVIVSSCRTVRDKHEQLVQHSLTKADPIQMQFLHDSTGVPITYDGIAFGQVSFNAAMLKLAVAGEAFLKDPVSECTDNCKFILNNGPWDLVEASLHSSRLYTQFSFNVLSNITSFAWVVVAVSYLISISVVLWKIFPVVNDIRKTRDALLDALEKVPPNQISMLKRKYRTKLRRAKFRIAALNGKVAPESMELLEDDNEDETKAQTQGSVGEKVQVAVTAGKDRSMKVFRKKVAPESNATTYKRFRRPNATHIKNIMRLSIPLLLLPVYFVTEAITLETIAKSLANEVGTIYWTGLLWITEQRAHVSIEAPTPPQPWSRWYTDPERYNASREIETFYSQMIEQSRNLNYGNLDAEIPVVPMMDKEEFPGQYDLQFTNACLSEECLSLLATNKYETINNLAFGLNSATENFIHRIGQIQNDPNIEAISFEATFHLAEAMKKSLMFYAQGLRLDTDHQMETQLLLTLGFLAVAAILCTVVYRTFKQTINQLKQAQYTLLMLPPELVRDVPELKELLNLNEK